MCLHVESEAELERASAIGALLGIRPAVALRVNPDFELKGSGMRMGGGAKPFGIDAERVPAVLRRLAALPVDFRGLVVGHEVQVQPILQRLGLRHIQEQQMGAGAVRRHELRLLLIALRSELPPEGFGPPQGESALVAAVDDDLFQTKRHGITLGPGRSGAQTLPKLVGS